MCGVTLQAPVTGQPDNTYRCMNLLYNTQPDGRVQCTLCPHHCVVAEGEVGLCRVRQAHKGTLRHRFGSRLSALRFDPVEKKPLYHFHPGWQILSIGGVGCNFQCPWCQNHTLSMDTDETFGLKQPNLPREVVSKALNNNRNAGIAFTYNEPVINFEFVVETAALAQTRGLSTAVVTNGYINQAPLIKLIEVTNAFNVDIKHTDEPEHQRLTGGKLSEVKRSVKTIAKTSRHLELTFLAITGINTHVELFEELCKWIADNAGSHIPLHISRYHPAWQFKAPPTPLSVIGELTEVANKHLMHVYKGNVHDDEASTTRCPRCNQILILRQHLEEVTTHLNQNRCPGCGWELYGVFQKEEAPGNNNQSREPLAPLHR